MEQKIFTKNEIAGVIGCTEKTITNHVKQAIENNKLTCIFKKQVYYYKRVGNKYVFSFTEFIINKDINLALEVSLATEIEDVNFNILVNGIKVK